MIEQVDIKIRNREELDKMISDIIDRRWFSEGPVCKQYLETIQKKFSLDHVFLAPNGTLGLYLALLAVGEGKSKGDVLVPSFTFYGSATSIVFAGFNPVFVDCSEKTFQSTLQNFKDACTPNTVGVMPVHIYGQVGEVEEICAWAKEKGFFSVEDAAQALGCKKKGKSAGTFADVGVFSTYSDKILTTGEGSILTCKTQELADKVRLVRNQGRPNAGTFTHPSLGMNFRMTELQAALGLHQLNSIEIELEERRAKYKYYASKMENVRGLGTMELITDSTLIPFRFPVLAENREKVQEALKAAGVQTRDFFVPMHMQPQFIKNQVKEIPNATKISKMGICLPVHHSVTNENIDLMFKAMS